MYAYQADVTVLLVRDDEVNRNVTAALSQDVTLSVSSRRHLTEAEVRDAMNEELRAKFGASMGEWRVKGEIASGERDGDIVAVLVLRGVHPSHLVGDTPHPLGRY
jgi:hypothetical protein